MSNKIYLFARTIKKIAFTLLDEIDVDLGRVSLKQWQSRLSVCQLKWLVYVAVGLWIVCSFYPSNQFPAL